MTAPTDPPERTDDQDRSPDARPPRRVVHMTAEEAARRAAAGEFASDFERLDAMTDDDIALGILLDLDAAPEWTEEDVEAARSGRPSPPRPTARVTLDVAADALAWFREQAVDAGEDPERGAAWRMAECLARYAWYQRRASEQGMDPELFAELQESVRQAGRIMRGGELPPGTRVTRVDPETGESTTHVVEGPARRDETDDSSR